MELIYVRPYSYVGIGFVFKYGNILLGNKLGLLYDIAAMLEFEFITFLSLASRMRVK